MTMLERLGASLLLLIVAFQGCRYMLDADAVYQRAMKRVGTRVPPMRPWFIRLRPESTRLVIRCAGAVAIALAVVYLVFVWVS